VTSHRFSEGSTRGFECW